MFDELLRLKGQPLQQTFKKVMVHGKPFVTVTYDNRTIGFVNKEEQCELKSPFMDEVLFSGILSSIRQSFSTDLIPPSINEMVMYVRGIMSEVKA